jgi:electron transport complex protein RnfG
MSGAAAILRSGATLAVMATVCTSLVAATWYLTADQIAANEKALLEKSLQPALANTFYDSSVSESRLVLEPPHGLPGSEAAIIYRVYSGDEPVAALFVVTARDGFAGPIRILLGVDIDGVVTGVRILEHR